MPFVTFFALAQNSDRNGGLFAFADNQGLVEGAAVENELSQFFGVGAATQLGYVQFAFFDLKRFAFFEDLTSGLIGVDDTCASGKVDEPIQPC